MSMLINCPACQASYDIPDHLLVNAPVRMRCARCGAEWAWMGGKALSAENFELPDLFAPGPLSPAPAMPHENRADLERSLMADPVPGEPLLAEPFLPESFLPEPVLPEPEQSEPEQSEPEWAREPIGSPVFHPSPEPSLPPLVVERPSPRLDGMIEIPRAPASKAPDIASNPAEDRARSREEIFRRIIETNRQRGLKPESSSRRPQIIAILALIVLIALFLGVHFVMVNGVTAGPAG